MNEFEKDKEKPYKPADGWISSSFCPVEKSMHEAVHGIPSVMMKKRYDNNGVSRCVEKLQESHNILFIEKFYPSLLAGVGAATLLGFVISLMRNKHAG